MERVFVLLLLNFLPLTISCPGQNEKAASSGAETFIKIEKLANEAIRKHNFPGISVGIVSGGELIYAEGFGYADRESKRRADRNTVYQIGSVTKTFTGNLLAQLIAEKRLLLEDPLTDFFPKTLKFPIDKNGKAITVKDIATHSAGFPRYPANLERTDGEPILGFSKQKLYQGIELVKIEDAAGVRYSYSNFGYGVLAAALENLTEETLDDLLNRRIFQPLKMTSSSLVLNDGIKSKLAVPYRDDNPNMKTQPWEMGALSGAGNIFSSINDLSLFMNEMLKKSVVNGIQQNVHLKINETWSYGLGCFVINSKTKNTKLIHHGGDLDSYASYLVLYPEYNAGIVVLTNSGMGQPFGEMAEEMNGIAFDEIFRNAKRQ